MALLFSFGGTCVKLIRPFFTPSMITFLRFLVGVLWLLGLKLARRQRFQADFASALKAKWGWLVFGAAVKYLAYITENTALSAGVSYGNILTRPVQIILHTILGVFVLRERMNAVKWVGIALCVAGILLIVIIGIQGIYQLVSIAPIPKVDGKALGAELTTIFSLLAGE